MFIYKKKKYYVSISLEFHQSLCLLLLLLLLLLPLLLLNPTIPFSLYL